MRITNVGLNNNTMVTIFLEKNFLGNWSVSQGSKRRMRDDEEEKEEYHGEV